MFAQFRKSQIIVTVVTGVFIVILVSYFSEGRTANTSLNPSSLKNHPDAPKPKDGSAQRNEDTGTRGRGDAGRYLDSDEDGLPDAVELSAFTDRENFRRWFTHLAEMQFYRLSEHWNTDQRDCSGLVRFAWREALRRHDRLWFRKMGPGYEQIAPDVSRYNLDQGPLDEKIFRIDPGSYRESDLTNGKFSEFADARSIKTFNSKFVSRNREEAKPGDLLLFHQPWVQKFPFHIMVYLGRASIADDGNYDWVVYHTGATATDQGTVKKVRLSTLDHHPNKRWRPVENNQNFLGFYRLKILE